MGTTKKHIGMNISRQNTNESFDTSSKANNTSSCNSINNIINRKNVYISTPTNKNIIINNCNNNNNRKNESLIKNNSAYLTPRRCLNKKSQLNINSNSKNNLNNELENNHNSKNISSYINKLSLAINNKQIHKIDEEQKQQQQQQEQKQKNSFNQHSNSFSFEKSKLENRNINKTPIVSVLNNSNSSNINNRNKFSKASVETYLKPFYLNEYSKCEKENSFTKTKKSSFKELKISNITNIQTSIERYENNRKDSQLDTPVIYLNSSLNTNFSLNHHRFNLNNSKSQKEESILDYEKLKENIKKNEKLVNNLQQQQTTKSNILSQNKVVKKKIYRPASIVSLTNKNDSVGSFNQLEFNDIKDSTMLSSTTNIINASATSFRLTQSQKEKCSKSYALKSNKSIASSSSSSQNLITSLNQNQLNKFLTATTIPHSHSYKSSETSKKSASKSQGAHTSIKTNKTSNSNHEYEGGLVEKMASFIDELKDFIDDRLIDTTSQLELANQRISGLYFNLNYLTSELINLKKQNEELKKELIFRNNTTRNLMQEQHYLDTYSDYSKKIHSKSSDRYIDSSCMKMPDSSSNLETTMNNSSSKTSSPETTSASSTSTSLIIPQTPLENLYKKSTTPPQVSRHLQRTDSTPKSSKDFKSGKHFELLNDLELKRRETRVNQSKMQSSSSSINSINFYDNMSIVNRFEINWPTRSTTDQNIYSHRTSSPSQLDLNNFIQTQYASTDFDNDELYENNDKNYDLLLASQQQSSSCVPNTTETLHYETNTPKMSTTSNIDELSTNDKDLTNEIVNLNQKENLVHHLHASITPYNNLISDFDTQYIWDYENNSLVNKFTEKSESNSKFQN